MRPVPQTWEEFQTYWEHKCSEELEINRAQLDIFTIRITKPWFVLLPTPVWDQMFKPWLAGQRWVAVGVFDPAVRERRPACAGRPATKWYCAFSVRPSSWHSWPSPTKSVCTQGHWLPTGGPPGGCRRMLRWSRHAAFMAPPKDRWGLPMHYVPRHKSLMERAGSLVHTTFSLAGLRPRAGRSVSGKAA